VKEKEALLKKAIKIYKKEWLRDALCPDYKRLENAQAEYLFLNAELKMLNEQELIEQARAKKEELKEAERDYYRAQWIFWRNELELEKETPALVLDILAKIKRSKTVPTMKEKKGAY